MSLQELWRAEFDMIEMAIHVRLGRWYDRANPWRPVMDRFRFRSLVIPIGQFLADRVDNIHTGIGRPRKDRASGWRNPDCFRFSLLLERRKLREQAEASPMWKGDCI